MGRYILKRLLSMLAVMMITVVIIFTLVHMIPGSPAIAILGENATEEAILAIEEEFGLNDPFLVQLGNYVLDLLHGDFGTSYRTKGPVLDGLLARYPTTLKITFGSVLIGLLFGVTAGIYSAVRQYSVLDRVLTSISLVGSSTPSFWIGMLLVLIFSVKLDLLPPSGSYGPEYWILPLITMGIQTSTSIMRMTRSCMLEVIRQDYIRTARAKGQGEFVIIMKHAFRNALLPILTVTGSKICYFLGGAVLIETVFALPGLGKYILDSVSNKDYPVVQGGVLLICLSCVLITFIVDMLYMLVDPRIKATYGFGKKKTKKEAAEQK